MRFSDMVTQVRKDMWEAKANYVHNLMERNAQVDTLTESQHEALRWLCYIRHRIHTERDVLWAAEQGDHEMLWNCISYEIEQRMMQQGLPPIHLGYKDSDYNTDSTWEYDYDSQDEQQSKLYGRIEDWNGIIEIYLSDIDEEHGTHYCPTGNSRF